MMDRGPNPAAHLRQLPSVHFAEENAILRVIPVCVQRAEHFVPSPVVRNVICHQIVPPLHVHPHRVVMPTYSGTSPRANVTGAGPAAAPSSARSTGTRTADASPEGPFATRRHGSAPCARAP